MEGDGRLDPRPPPTVFIKAGADERLGLPVQAASTPAISGRVITPCAGIEGLTGKDVDGDPSEGPPRIARALGAHEGRRREGQTVGVSTGGGICESFTDEIRCGPVEARPLRVISLGDREVITHAVLRMQVSVGFGRLLERRARVITSAGGATGVSAGASRVFIEGAIASPFT